MKDSFTLLELVIVIVILAILTSIATLQYNKSIIHTHLAKAQHAISLIAEAEKIYQLEVGSYVDVSDGNFDNIIGSGGPSGISLTDIDNDSSWDYQVRGNTITATFKKNNKTVTYNMDTGAFNIDSYFK